MIYATRGLKRNNRHLPVRLIAHIFHLMQLFDAKKIYLMQCTGIASWRVESTFEYDFLGANSSFFSLSEHRRTVSLVLSALNLKRQIVHM